MNKPVVEEKPECFVIMPISDPEGYPMGHFKDVYDGIFKVACDNAGYTPIRADDVTHTNLIHLDILKKLLNSEMAICDLSTRNPNVLFELGIRQAFNKPTLLVQEFGTPKIFDISIFRITDYRRELNYKEVCYDQDRIKTALLSTKESASKGEDVNSIIRLLSLTGGPATMSDGKVSDNELFTLIMSEISGLRNEIYRNDERVIQMRDSSTENVTTASSLYKRANDYYGDFFAAIDARETLDRVTARYENFRMAANAFLSQKNAPDSYKIKMTFMKKEVEKVWSTIRSSDGTLHYNNNI